MHRTESVARDGAFTSRRGSGEGLLHCHTHPAQDTNNSRNELHDLLQSNGLTTNDPSKRTAHSAQNELVGGKNESQAGDCSLPSMPCRRSNSFASIHEPTPHPSCSGWRKRRSPTPSPLGRGLLRRTERVARDGAFTSRRGSGEGSLHCHPHPAQNTNNSGNELHDLLQSKALTTNDPSKRTGHSAQNEPVAGKNESGAGDCSLRSMTCRQSTFFAPIHKPTPHPSCSGWRKRRSPTPSPLGRGLLRRVGERVARDGAFSRRRRSGEGSLPCCTRPAQHTENSGNEIHDLLQTHNLAHNVYTKRTISEAQNELVGGVHESDGPVRPIHEPTPHPSCSGWRKRRSPTPSPLGRGLLRRMGGEGNPRRHSLNL